MESVIPDPPDTQRDLTPPREAMRERARRAWEMNMKIINDAKARKAATEPLQAPTPKRGRKRKGPRPATKSPAGESGRNGS